MPEKPGLCVVISQTTIVDLKKSIFSVKDDYISEKT